MLKLRKGCEVPYNEKLSEGYMRNGNVIYANVDADKIHMLLEEFIARHEEELFFILELPTRMADENVGSKGAVESFHVDVYYMDGCSQQEARIILEKVGDLLVNDGVCRFGFGGHNSQDEFLVGKYNVIVVYGAEHECFTDFFEKYDIHAVEKLVTAWDTFSAESPGISKNVTTNGKKVYDIPEMFKDWGIYFAERREE